MAIRTRIVSAVGDALAFVFTVVVGIAMGCILSVGEVVEDPMAAEKRRAASQTHRAK